MMKPANYNKLDSRGFVEKDLYVDSKDVIIGKILPTKSKSNEDIKEKRPFQDHSTTLKSILIGMQMVLSLLKLGPDAKEFHKLETNLVVDVVRKEPVE